MKLAYQLGYSTELHHGTLCTRHSRKLIHQRYGPAISDVTAIRRWEFRTVIFRDFALARMPINHFTVPVAMHCLLRFGLNRRLFPDDGD